MNVYRVFRLAIGMSGLVLLVASGIVSADTSTPGSDPMTAVLPDYREPSAPVTGLLTARLRRSPCCTPARAR